MANYATLEEVKEYLNIEDNSQDNLLLNLIYRVTQLFDSYLSRKLSKAEYTDIFGGNNRNYHMTKQYPVIEVIEAKSDGQAVSVVAFVDNEVVIQERFGSGSLNCSVKYIAGYDPIPYDITQCCIELVGVKYKNIANINIQSKSMGNGETITFTTKDLPSYIKVVLNQYKRVI